MSDAILRDDKVPWWIKVFRELGLPVAIICVMGYGGWHAVTWFGNSIALPMFQRQMIFIDEVQKATQDIASAVQQGEKSRAEMAGHLQAMSETAKEQTSVLEEIKAELKKQ